MRSASWRIIPDRFVTNYLNRAAPTSAHEIVGSFTFTPLRTAARFSPGP
jgi:hypothetical protein